jgi:hypothetical protein
VKIIYIRAQKLESYKVRVGGELLRILKFEIEIMLIKNGGWNSEKGVKNCRNDKWIIIIIIM